jgi:hypothetical protein
MTPFINGGIKKKYVQFFSFPVQRTGTFASLYLIIKKIRFLVGPSVSALEVKNIYPHCHR